MDSRGWRQSAERDAERPDLSAMPGRRERARRSLAVLCVLFAAFGLVGCRGTTSNRAQQRQRETGAAANRVVFWAACDQVAELTDAQLGEWRDRGIGGFVCNNRSLTGFGGDQDFSGDSAAPLSGTNYRLQRFLRDSRIVSRAAAYDIKLWLGIRLVNYFNTSTPLAEWFDDR